MNDPSTMIEESKTTSKAGSGRAQTTTVPQWKEKPASFWLAGRKFSAMTAKISVAV
jgi:hypothetical protein